MAGMGSRMNSAAVDHVGQGVGEVHEAGEDGVRHRGDGEHRQEAVESTASPTAKRRSGRDERSRSTSATTTSL